MPLVRIQGDGPSDDPADKDLQFTDRGFAVFYTGEDSKGMPVRVQESSEASGDFVWIFSGELAPHLDPDQADAVARALLTFSARARRRASRDFVPEEIPRPTKPGPALAAVPNEADPEDGHAT